MDRRRFLKLTAAAGTGIAISSTLPPLIDESASGEGHDLIVARGASPSRITEAAIGAIGGMKKFVSRGDVVVVKPNMAFDRVPEQAANTNPEVVATVVRLCMEAGARKVKVFDRSVNDPRRCYTQSGIADAVRRYYASVRYVDERKFRNMSIKGMALNNWPIYTEIMEADKIINVPIAKHHGLAGLTMGMKNLMGILGGTRSRIHQKLDMALVDISGFIKPTLTILDAIRILITNGPQGGNLKDVKRLDTVVAGVDQVAVDSFGATLFGMKGEDLGYVRIGSERGLGIMDLEKLSIKRITV